MNSKYLNPSHCGNAANSDNSTPSIRGFLQFLVIVLRISILSPRVGRPTCNVLSNLPGLNTAGSIISGKNLTLSAHWHKMVKCQNFHQTSFMINSKLCNEGLKLYSICTCHYRVSKGVNNARLFKLALKSSA